MFVFRKLFIYCCYCQHSPELSDYLLGPDVEVHFLYSSECIVEHVQFIRPSTEFLRVQKIL